MKKFMYRSGAKVFTFIEDILLRMAHGIGLVRGWFYKKVYYASDDAKRDNILRQLLDNESHFMKDAEKFTNIKKGGCEVQDGVFRRTDC